MIIGLSLFILFSCSLNLKNISSALENKKSVETSVCASKEKQKEENYLTNYLIEEEEDLKENEGKNQFKNESLIYHFTSLYLNSKIEVIDYNLVFSNRKTLVPQNIILLDCSLRI